MIEQGRVEVDGTVIDHLGIKVDPATARISVDGIALKKFRPVYYAVNKPAGVLCTNRDPQGRPRAVDLIPGHQRLFPVGRLDASSVGLLLMTNDGELTQRLTHPKHGVPKTYFVVVAGKLETPQLRRLQRGIHLAEGLARVEGAKIRRERKGCTELEITLCEGKNREIRRVLARLGNKVITLRRLAIGPLKLADLPESAYRPLSKDEVAALYRAADEAAKARRRKAKTDSEAGEANAGSPPAGKVRSPKAKSPTLRTATGSDDSQGMLDSVQSPRPTLKGKEAKPRDPFAWDNDEELLAASPFAGDYRSQMDDDFADEENADEGLFESSQPPSFEDDDESIDSEEFAKPLGPDTVLVSEAGRGRGGQVLDYDHQPARPSRKQAGSGQPRGTRTAKKSARFSLKKTPGSLKRTPGKKKSGKNSPRRSGAAKEQLPSAVSGRNPSKSAGPGGRGRQPASGDGERRLPRRPSKSRGSAGQKPGSKNSRSRRRGSR